MTVRISGLNYFPVKSLGIVSTGHIQITEWGVHRDRRMMLIDENNKFITQRQYPLMSMINIMDDGKQLTLSFKTDRFTFPWPDFSIQNANTEVSIWKESISAQSVSGEVDQWLSNILQVPVSLVYIADQTHRQVDMSYAREGDRVSFADGFPLLLISQASIDFLSEKLPFDLDMKRFRPNMVVSGCEPFEEDQWKEIEINGIRFDVSKPCSRCVIPSINPDNAEKQPEVMQLLIKERKRDGKVYLGQNLIHRELGELNLGDEMVIIR